MLAESLEPRKMLAAAPLEGDPGNTLATAALVTFDSGSYVASATIGDGPSGNADVDLFRVEVAAGTMTSVSTKTNLLTPPSTLSPAIRLFTEAGDPVQLQFSNGNMVFGSVSGGVYFVGVSGFGNEFYDPTTGEGGVGTSETGAYELSIQSVVDVAAPTLQIQSIPSPNAGNLPIPIRTSEPVVGLDISDFQLTRNGEPVPFADASEYSDYVSGWGEYYSLFLNSAGREVGTYVLSFNPAGAGVTDLAGNPLVAQPSSVTWAVVRPQAFASGPAAWAGLLSAGGVNGSPNVSAIAPAPGGGALIAGSFSGAVNFDPLTGGGRQESSAEQSAFVARYDQSGRRVAFFQTGRDSSGIATISGLALRPDGSLAVAGSYSAELGTIDLDPSSASFPVTGTGLFVAVYDPATGSPSWVRTIATDPSSPIGSAQLAAAPDGGILLAALAYNAPLTIGGGDEFPDETSVTVPNGNAFAAAFSATGSLLGASPLGANRYLGDLLPTSDGFVMTGSVYDPTTYNETSVLTKLDTSAAVVWETSATQTTSASDWFADLTIDADGSILAGVVVISFQSGSSEILSSKIVRLSAENGEVLETLRTFDLSSLTAISRTPSGGLRVWITQAGQNSVVKVGDSPDFDITVTTSLPSGYFSSIPDANGGLLVFSSGLPNWAIPTGSASAPGLVAGSGNSALFGRVSDPFAAVQPTGVFEAVASPLATPLNEAVLKFSEPVQGVDASDFSLWKNGVAQELPADFTVASADGGTTWIIGGLGIAESGGYVLLLESVDSEIVTVADGLPLAATNSPRLEFQIAVPAPDNAGDTIATAYDLGTISGELRFAGQWIGGGASGAKDVDVYRIAVSAGQRVTIDVLSQALGGENAFDTHLRVFDAAGEQLWFDDDGGLSTDSRLTFDATAGGEYFVAVSSYGNHNYDPTVTTGRQVAQTGLYDLVIATSEIVITQPDLVVTGLGVAQTSIQSGGLVTVQWTASNTGTANAYTSWNDRILVVNTTTGQTLVDQTLLNGWLSAGGSFTRQYDLTLPQGLAGVGELLITVTADSSGLVSEHNDGGTGETNNSASITVTSALAPAPDLQITGLSVAEGVIQSGGLVTVRWNNTNTGTADIPGWGWYDRVRVVNTTTNATLLDTLAYAAPQSIAAGESAAREYSFTLPQGMSSVGTLAIEVTADQFSYDGGAGYVVEQNFLGTGETNNSASITVTSALAPSPDLQVTGLSVAEGVIQSGGLVTVRWNDTNTGTADITGWGWYDRVRVVSLTTNAVVAEQSLYYSLNNSTVAPGGSVAREYSFMLPHGDAGVGEFSIEILTDSSVYDSGFVYEYNPLGTAETNNSASITITSALAPYPDLQVTGLSVAEGVIQSGGWVTVRWNEINTGTGNASGSWTNRICVVNTTTNATVFDIAVYNDAEPIAAGSSVAREYSFWLPDGLAGVGTFSIEVTADYSGTVVERNADGSGETNNSASITVTSALAPYPDLQVTGLSVAEGVIQSGGQVTVRWNEINTGTADAPDWPWADRIRVVNLATNETLVNTTIFNSAQIAVGGSVAKEYSFTLPDGLAGAGPLSISVTVDGSEWVFEHNVGGDGEANNTAVITVTSLMPAVFSTEAARFEGQDGQTAFTFAVRRVGDLSAAGSVEWVVSPVGSRPASAADFAGGVLPSGTAEFAAGAETATIVFFVSGDTGFEANETFAVTVSNPVNAVLEGRLSATGTIRNDDARFSSPFDVIFVQDLSGSYSDDIVTVRSLLPSLLDDINSIQPGTSFAVTSFVDKPVSPFGSTGDYTYSTDLPLTSNTEAVVSAYGGLVVRGGDDTPESQLEALLQISLRAAELGRTTSRQTVALLFTDAEYHVAGDGAFAGISQPNNYDTILDGTPAGSGEDYPGITQLRDRLLAANVIPVFAVTSDVVATYQQLINTMAIGGVVVTLASDSSNIADAVTSALTNLYTVEVALPTGGLAVDEAGASASFQLRLSSRPSHDVTVSMAPGDITEGVLSSTSIVFTPDNWNIYQTVTLTGIPDPEGLANADGDRQFPIVFSPLASDDLLFNGVVPANLFAVNKNVDLQLPTITVTGGLASLTTTYGTDSEVTGITVSGTGLSGSITVSAPTGFEVSSDGVAFGATASFAVTAGAASGTLSIRLAAGVSVGQYTGNVTLVTAGATEIVIPIPTATVTAKTLSIVGATAADKVYDGTADAIVTWSSIEGLVAGDSVTVTATGTFDTANAGTGIGVTASVVLSGGAAANYVIAQPTSLFATISPKAISIAGVSALDKIYDGTTAADLTGTATYVGLVSGEVFDVLGTGLASFADRNAGADKAVTVGGYLAPTGNYAVSQPTGLTATITKKSLSIAGASAESKTYDGTTHAEIAWSSLDGLIEGDDVSADGSGAFAQANVGTGILVTPSLTLSGSDSNNYVFTPPTGLRADITRRLLSISGVEATNKTYDGTTIATLTGTAAYVGLADGEAFNVVGSPVASFADKHVGSGKPVTVTGYRAPTDNYTVEQPTDLSADISRRPLSVRGATARSRIYDGTDTATIIGARLMGVVAGDVVTVSGGGTFAQPNAGTGIVVTPNLSISGTEADNYDLTQPTGLTASITRKALTVTGAFAENKVYDGTNTAVINWSAVNGIVGSDSVTVSGGGTFAQRNAGTGIRVTPTLTLNGPDNGNYTLSQPFGLTANIARKALSITGVTAADKTYNGTAFTTLSGTPSYSGLVSGETFAVAGSPVASFANKNVGNGKPVTVTGYLAPSGNYTVAQPTGLSASIDPKTLTVTGATARSRIYDGTDTATIIGARLTGVVVGDAVTVSGDGTFAQRNAGTGIAVTPNLAIGGTDAGNYSLTQPTGLMASITRKALTVTGASAANKVYDGTNTAVINWSAVSGIVGGDSVTVSGGGTFAQRNAGIGIRVTPSLTLTGAQAANYAIVQPTGLTANITPKMLIVTADNKTKTVNTDNPRLTATITGFVTGEGISRLTGVASLFTTATRTSPAGTQPITVSRGTLRAINGNYEFTFVSGTLTVS